MADVELLPCAECGMPCRAGEYHPFAACLMFKACHNSETVRANLVPLQAENERLRAEVATWEGLHASEVQVRQRWQARAERLAEALEDIRSRSSIDLAMRSDQFELTAMLGDIHQIAGAALAQEDDQ